MMRINMAAGGRAASGLVCGGQLVHHLLLVDEVVGLVHQVHQVGHAGGPLVQHGVGVFLLAEADHAFQPVNLGLHRLADHQVGQELFSLLKD